MKTNSPDDNKPLAPNPKTANIMYWFGFAVKNYSWSILFKIDARAVFFI